MFNPLTPAEVMRAVGRVARAAAKSDEGFSQFARVQLLSSYSACRHLAVEVEAYPEFVREFLLSLRAALNQYVSDSRRLSAIISRVMEFEDLVDCRQLGELVSALLEELRGEDGEEAAQLRRKIRSLLRELVNAEVTLLTRAIERVPSRG